MNSGSPAEGANEEIVALIESLHRTGQRLEELTAGEVDTVSDSSGRTFLLQSAQEHLRLSEAAKQAAILNALPANIALLNAQGIIISVNQAWQRFAGENAFPYTGFGIGLNYLQICDSAQGEGASEAHQAAEAIRSILTGSITSFSLEYPCHSPTEQRWFLMTVTPMDDNRSKGAVVMHMDVTAQRQTKEDLRASELRFRQMAENIGDVFFLLDAVDSRMLYVSPAYEVIWGHSCESLYKNPQSWMETVHPDDQAATYKTYRKSLMAVDANFQFRIVRHDGSIRWIEVKSYPVRDDDGSLVRIAGLAKDITEYKAAEAKIAYLNRVYAMLSDINALIVREHDRDNLFKEACRIAVEAGGFRMSLIVIMDRGLKRFIPIASAGGDEALLVAIKGILSSSEKVQKSMVVRAIQEKTAVVSNDSQNDPKVLLGGKYAEFSVRSMAILPLIVADEVVGVFALYASEIGFFREEEMALLTELAGDIAFAIDHIAKRERLDYLAYYDELTGLANRRLFLERVAQYMSSAIGGEHKLAVLLIDLERFKNINNSLGQLGGDALLKQVAEWLTANAGEASLIARMGADHFAVVLPKVTQDVDVVRLIEKTLATFQEHQFHLHDAVFRIAIKIGATLFPDDGASADTLVRNAEAALKKAKTSGFPYLFYTQKMTEAMAHKLSLENQLRQALDNEEFVLHYQPKVNLASGKLTSAEALIRWNDPRTGLVPPARFIPILEETGLINDVGRWALHKAIDDYLRWHNAGLAAVRVAVNVSPLQLRDRGFSGQILQAIDIHEQAPFGLELEITESLIMADVKHSIASLQTIRAMGISIAIDDFGTGFSSLSYLSKLPVDTLKIDRSFVIEMTESSEGLLLVSTIINLAHSLKLKVVAEGVETEEQASMLRRLHCDEMQGYLFSKPVPGEIFETRFLSPLLLK
ncbi:GGDEF domain-containing phosphodiesterase [Methylotuvimicrobium buryatense]|uniref:cyclic-guanylate-specific phosphodiesterase n=1 Tax=Methylotuvimicrobium buryatense TaxID=95641 RepID=A0A4P9UU04_METBY|nr:GGDEF domain-containing phosphodiesterase [Methylotuvimicrobium buryatense]QCW83136.1 phosphodiesterase [Methylotuvimicrobium buryatense]